ncbi:Transcription factor [Lithohypha guttulata]|uniref:Transcription factor n=1 Tax=Lithohypha guttulata TaxID=1690604 RepID=UPI002DE0E92A|nr:Transcription factor [Lithohypha guttulata]
MAESKPVKQENMPSSGTSRKSSPVQHKQPAPDAPAPTAEDSKPTQVSEPLAPPPKPAPATTAQTPDYFSAVHGNNNEFNPFEQSFGAPSTETPGKTLLPPVAALESPAITGANNATGYNWNQGLRAGPLSPAMLEGPAGGGDYFGNISRGFPTPNESSLRTGLTPGGGGSMFPAPSPNSQAIFNSLQSGGATPGTLDFHRTAMNAAARNKFPNTSNPQEQPGQNGNMDAQHDATDAANGLFMLAKGGQANQFAPNNNQQNIQTRSQVPQRTSNASAEDIGSPDDEDSKPNTRGKKGAKVPPANGRRKSEAVQKGSNKRQKTSIGSVAVDPALDPDVDPDDDESMDEEMQEELKNGTKNGKKMTDEEKRRNFLERNRVAALKCRQRKKQWLANLQAKVEMYSAENDSLNTQVATLHDEIRNLRNLLIQHKDCPVGHAQGIGQFLAGMQDPNAAFAHQQMNPYGMAMPNGGMQPGMPQRAG